jgi:hypothetical protein
MGTDEPVSALVVAGHEGHAGQEGHPGEGGHDHHTGLEDSARGQGHHQGSHPGGADCRSGSACGATGVVTPASARVPASLPVQVGSPRIADSWATFIPGHETPPPRLLV